MEELSKKISYIKGYAEGLNISEKSNEGKVLLKILDLLDDISENIERIDANTKNINMRLEETEDDISMLMEDVYCDDDESDDFLDDFDDDEEDDDILDFDEKDDQLSDDYFEIQCPGCGEDVLIDFDMIDEDNGIICPNCHEEIELSFDCECDDEDCDCHNDKK